LLSNGWRRRFRGAGREGFFLQAKPLSTLTALVLDAQDSHALSAIRSLGLQGAEITAVSPKPQAMGTASRYCRRALRSPNPATEPQQYAAWLLKILQEERFDALLFFGEASANVVAQHRDAILGLTGCLVSEHETFMTADRKDRITRLAASIGVPVPASYELAHAEGRRHAARSARVPGHRQGSLGQRWPPSAIRRHRR
jgi:predicted ATP-grasp superfamily ATP-dependent carboligase